MNESLSRERRCSGSKGQHGALISLVYAHINTHTHTHTHDMSHPGLQKTWEKLNQSLCAHTHGLVGNPSTHCLEALQTQ